MEAGSKSVPVQITEDEAAVYDRQIRLWGLEAQQRMRNATILVVKLKGVATEAVKNIVLAGIGRLVIVDEDDVAPEDLGCNFLLRDEDVGKKRAEAAKPRVESLNPLVTVEVITSYDVLRPSNIDATLQGVDLVCVTEFDKLSLFELNEACRRLNKPFYAGGSYGLLGYIFCDLLQHEYIAPDRSGQKDAPKTSRATVNYCPLNVALQHKWSGMTRRQTKELNLHVVFTVLALWEYQAAHKTLPDDVSAAAELQTLATSLLAAAQLNTQAKVAIPEELTTSMATTAAHEFSPVCAVIGGMLAQDILKALAAREPPIANFLTFDGSTGAATVCRMNM
ncbi:hypothetical protein PUNSTDRAFT_97317 [Punctularia strigosozonata HHB-11173 SS5]|uniref:uncharacterized protein n=1 Tax=Punctularia strigosozonata (strain HHB-11173) TaxID=741275 RepID=UPI00044174CE|nr:uncharacterized protein PUNSTDRAFT_97317 [Punctularia strigosozonata HHB-11173 SS5]EIN12546.1 hypothetical protein PUNSTDRAFT_97317 [Punctularia strigosozonata HHB-11173 SS5]